MSLLLSVRSLAKSFGPRMLFRGISFGLFDEQHVGLIGPNGSGKSTLLKMLAGIEHVDEGQIEARRGLRVGYVAQEPQFDGDDTVEHAIASAIQDDDAHHLDEHERLVRANVQLGRIGLPDPQQRLSMLSGGGRKRVAIAQQLAREPDLLFMDEPTNHLDYDAIRWLEKLLASAPFAALIVSHDRAFLENVSNRTIELNGAYPDGFLSVDGAYDRFLEEREAFLAAQQSREQSVAGRVRREIEWLKRGAKARTTKAKGRIQQAERMMDELADLRTRNAAAGAAQIDFHASDRQTRKLVELRGVTKSLGGRTLFKNLDLVLAPKMKLGLLGANGSGKSTLLRVITGQLPPDAGEVRRAAGLKVVLFDQNREQLEKTESLRRSLSPTGDNVTWQGASMHISAWAKRFLFRVDQLDLPVGELSGGEQARVLIARLMLRPADVLILDEPTNDLDIPTLDVLEESLEEFPGALVLVTHDRYLLDRVSTDLLALDGQGNANRFAALWQWEQAIEEQNERERTDKSRKAPPVQRDPATMPSRPKRLSWNEQREWERMEADILTAEQKAAELEARAAEADVVADHVKLRDAYSALHAAQAEVERLYARWAELERKQK